MDGIRKLLSALVVLAAGIFWATHAHAAAPIAEVAEYGAGPVPARAVTMAFDTDAKAAAAERRTLHARRARERAGPVVAHLPVGGIGHIRSAGRGYVCVPAAHSRMR